MRISRAASPTPTGRSVSSKAAAPAKLDVFDAKQGGVRSDRERQSHDRGRGEGRRSAKAADGVPSVLPQGVEHTP